MTRERLVHTSSLLLLVVWAMLAPGLGRLRVDADLLQLYAAFAERPPGPERTVLLAVPGPLDEVDRILLEGRLASVPGVLGASVPRALSGQLSTEDRAKVETVLDRTDDDAVAVTVRVQAGDRAVLDALTATLPDVAQVGAPVLDRAHAEAARDAQLRLLGVLLPGMGLLVVGVLRSIRHALVVLVAVGIGASGLAGAMGYAGIALGGPNLLLLPLVVVLGVADSVHLYTQVQDKSPLDALAAVVIPCALTSLTTGLAFATLVASPIAAVRTFGLLAAVGMAVALLTGLVLPTSALLLLGGRVRPVGGRMARGVSRVPGLAVGGMLLLFVFLAAKGTTDLRIGGELPVGDPTLETLREVDEQLAGVYPAVMHVHTGKPDGVFDAKSARVVLEVHQALASSPGVGTVHSWADVLEVAFGSPERARSMMRGPLARANYKRVVREALPVIEAAGLPLLSADRSSYLVHVRFHERGARRWARTLERVRAAGDVEVQGHVALAVDAWKAILPELLRVLGASVVSVMLVVGLWTRSWRGALGGGLVLTGSAASTLATLVVLGQPISHANIFVVALAIGVGADGWIHLARPEIDVAEVGSALTSTAGVLCGGFLLLGTSMLPTLRAIGLALAVSVAFTWVLTLVLRRVLVDRAPS